MKEQILLPTLLDTFPEDFSESSQTDVGGDAEEAAEAEEESVDPNCNKVVDVACGAGFTVAVLKSGRVASWGVYIGGRLGLGPTPRLTVHSKKIAGKKTLARYQLRPKFVPCIFNAISVSCGEAHSLCIAGENELFAWGQNSCGQLGVGCDSSGFLFSCTYPAAVHPFSRTERDEFVRAVSVTCGSYHSLVVDGEGSVWSWGARGGSCIGHNDAPLQGSWKSRVDAVFTQSAKVSKVLVSPCKT